MKKFIFILIIIIFILNNRGVCSTPKQKKLENGLQKCKTEAKSYCYLKLLEKYNDQDQRNLIRYEYARALLKEKEYEKARINLKKIINNSGKNKEIIKKAKFQLNLIEEKQKKISTANKNDTGDYFNEQDIKRWENPQNLTIYISSKTGKEYIFYKAVKIYNDTFKNKIYMKFVDNEKKANIIIEYVDKLEGSNAGKAYTTYKTVNQIKYIKKANIKVAKLGSDGNKLPDVLYLGTTLHELGHAIGLPHSNKVNDIMFPGQRSRYRKNTLSQRDINTVLKLYK